MENSDSKISTTNVDEEKYKKLKICVISGILASIVIICWHLYESYLHERFLAEHKSTVDYDIQKFTAKLFAEEMNYDSYLTKVNFQNKVKLHKRDDSSPKPLLELNTKIIDENPNSTLSLMKRLLDNYELNTNTKDLITKEKSKEEMEFLNAIVDTKAMQMTMEFLRQQNLSFPTRTRQVQLLKDIWFTPYSRSNGILTSSGFEHVFLAEINNRTLIGLHSWLYFYEQELKGHLNYHGYINHIDFHGKNKHLLHARFNFHNLTKPYNSLFIGTSPEFEMSLYTVCFLLKYVEPCVVKLDQKYITILMHIWDWQQMPKILTSAYPTIIY